MNIAIVGGGTRCLYLLDFIKKHKFNIFKPSVVAVADPKDTALGLIKAKELGLFVTNDYNELFARDDIELIVELTGDMDIYNDILAKKKKSVRAMAHTTAILFWEIDDAYKKADDFESQLTEKENIYEVLMNQFIQEEAMVIDTNYRVLDINEAMLNKLGLKAEEALGQYCYKIGHHQDQPCSGENHPCPLAEIYEKNRPCMTTHTHLDQNGNEIYYAISCYPLANNHEINGVIEIMRDITQEIKIQKAHMQQEKLISIGRLSAGIAHEINNPLTTIMTSSMMLQEEVAPDEEISKELAVISAEAQRCRKIVQNLLDFARQTKPMQKLQDINAIVRDNIYLTKKQAEFKDVYVDSSLADDLPRIYIDKEQIQQILINLTLNAVEATDSGGWITFTTSYDPSADEILITVSDTGSGISSENQEKIFDPFYTTREDGTGLGLSITHSIVEQHGGRIEIDSRPGHGSRFTVSLPVGGVP
ncbi:MAG: PAS domain-containing protein [Desulfobacterales bacterium]|nr:PAS domain-containing protein [Desulfobacterales bacterium]